MIKTVIFDFDMTLVDSIAAITTGLNKIASHFDLPQVTENDTKRVVALSTKELWHSLWGRYDEAWRVYFLESVAKQEKDYLQVSTGTIELLTRLKALGLSLAMATNRSNAWSALASVNLAKYFDTAVGITDVPHCKPAPDMLFKAMKRMRAEPAQTIFIGDAASDMEAATRASILGVGISGSGTPQQTLLQAGAWQVHSTLLEMGNAIFPHQPSESL